MTTVDGYTDVPNLREETLEKIVWHDPEKLSFFPFDRPKPTETEIDQFHQTIHDYRGAQPIVIDDAGNVIAGRGRVEGALLLDIEEIPALPLASLTADDLDHYIKTLVSFGHYVGWTRRMLRVELQHLLQVYALLTFTPEIRPRRKIVKASHRRRA